MRNPVVKSSIDVIMTYVYDMGIQRYELGLASAISVMVLLATLVMTAVVWKLPASDGRTDMSQFGVPATDTAPDRTGATSHQREHLGDHIFHDGVIVLLAVLMLMMVVPFLNVVAVAFSAPLASMERGIILWPRDFSVEGFKTVWVNLDLQRAFINSAIVTSAGTVAHVALCCLAAYVLIQKDLPGRTLILGFTLPRWRSRANSS